MQTSNRRVVAALVASDLVVALVAACGPPQSPDASPRPSASPPPSLAPVTDADIAFDAASRFETARAGGQWADAWDLLAPSSQSAARSLQEFTLAEVAYNAEGGTAFIVTEPSRDPGLVEQLVGERRALIATEADLERAWVVLITHPGQTTAAAAARAYLVAPLRVGGEWRLWPLR